MGPYVAATIFAWAAHGLAFAVASFAVPRNERLPALALWAAAAAALFAFKDSGIVMFAVTVLLVGIAPRDGIQRVAFFLAAVAIVPMNMSEMIPFPGINVLTLLTPYKLISAVLLLSVFLTPRSHDVRSTSISMADIGIVLYVLYTTIIVAIASDIAFGLRYLLDQFLILFLPYFCVRQTVKSLDDLEACLRACLVCAIALAAISLVSTARNWDFYQSMTNSLFSVPDTRRGFIRINGPVGTHSLGYAAAGGLIALECLRSSKPIGFLPLMAMRAVMLGGLYFTDSRGAMGGLAVAAAVYMTITMRHAIVRWLLLTASMAGFVSAAIWLLVGDFSPDTSEEDGNSITYRQELLRTSLSYISNNLVFGDFNFLESGKFEHLRQGQGIIDITNFYLQIALHYGLVGFVLFFGIVIDPLCRVFGVVMRGPRNLEDAGQSRDTDPMAGNYSLDTTIVGDLTAGRATRRAADVRGRWTAACGAVTGILAGWLFLISTTSDVGLTVHTGIIFAALLCSLLQMEQTAENAGPQTNLVSAR